jgi:hypothetical protein
MIFLLLNKFGKKSRKMSEKTFREHCHCHGTSAIDILPNAVLQHCFSFISVGNYRYVAGTSRRFRNLYSESKTTTWARAAESISSAELCLDDARQETKREFTFALEMLSLKAASLGRINVLEWARSKGANIREAHFSNSASNGHICILKWAEDNNLEWYSPYLMKSAIGSGCVNILDFVHTTGRHFPERASHEAAGKGQISVLAWMKEHDMLDTTRELWQYAAYEGHTHVLDWLWANDYRGGMNIDWAASRDGRVNVFVWLRQHDIAWSDYACAYASYYGSLALLQWLRENDCPWGKGVLKVARSQGHTHVLNWAIENGCQDHEEEYS